MAATLAFDSLSLSHTQTHADIPPLPLSLSSLSIALSLSLLLLFLSPPIPHLLPLLLSFAFGHKVMLLGVCVRSARCRVCMNSRVIVSAHYCDMTDGSGIGGGFFGDNGHLM